MLVSKGRRGYAKGKAKSRSNLASADGISTGASCPLPLVPVLARQLSDQCMFCNLTVNTVRGALFNLTITADLEQYIVKLERGKAADNSRATSDCWTSIGKKTGD